METMSEATKQAAPLLAFHGKQETKDFYLARVRIHRAADQLVQGYGYWKRDSRAGGEFRGCAVGCTLHSSDHGAYETELGIPRILARLEDGIFERLPADRAMAWPEEFLMAAQPGADLSLVWARFALWLMKDETWGVINFAKTERAKESIERVAALFARRVAGDVPSKQEYAAAAAAKFTATRAAARVAQADKLLELMASAPVLQEA